MIINSKNISDRDINLINKYENKTLALSKDMIYAFEITLCDNELDADCQVISTESLYKLKDLALGHFGFLTSDIKARIFDTYIEKIFISRSNSALAEEIYKLKAKVYVLKKSITEEELNKLLNHPKISVGFSVKRRVCSICGSSECFKHIKGQKYIDEAGIELLCYRILNDPTDFYEWSIVPNQQEPKSHDNKPKENEVSIVKTKLMINGKLTDVELDGNGGITVIKPEIKVELDGNGRITVIKPEIKAKRKITGWEKVEYGKTYYYDSSGLIYDTRESICEKHTINYNNANYFSNMKLADNISRMQTLQRKMFRWQTENDIPIKFDANKAKYYIMYNLEDKEFNIGCTYTKLFNFLPYFSSREKALNCIGIFKNELIWLFTEFQWRMDGDSNK